VAEEGGGGCRYQSRGRRDEHDCSFQINKARCPILLSSLQPSFVLARALQILFLSLSPSLSGISDGTVAVLAL
jgi:hypothetical protein